MICEGESVPVPWKAGTGRLALPDLARAPLPFLLPAAASGLAERGSRELWD